jgi:transcriptional regulator NrdR family protein
VGYDFDFYKNLADKSYRDYNYIIIDGYIESMGEIHHMLYEASNNKEPYVIFCYGMSEEVKHNIMINNHRGITRVLPVSLDSNDETTLNVLNDIAALHDGDVVSSNLGQTISQEIRKKLKKGKKITFFENSIYLEPVCSDDKIKKHRGFLLNRLADASKKSDVNTDPLKRRIRNFTSKKLNLYLPKILKDDNSFQRELDYFLRMTKYLDKNLEIIDLGFKKNYIVPKILKEYANRKSKSLQKTFDSIKIVIS